MAIAQVFGSGSTLAETIIVFSAVTIVLVAHGYQHRPQVTITDDLGRTIRADIQLTATTVRVTFAKNLTGIMYLR